jgi:hypothetical protein
MSAQPAGAGPPPAVKKYMLFVMTGHGVRTLDQKSATKMAAVQKCLALFYRLTSVLCSKLLA